MTPVTRTPKADGDKMLVHTHRPVRLHGQSETLPPIDVYDALSTEERPRSTGRDMAFCIACIWTVIIFSCWFWS